MRFLLISDTHGKLGVINELAERTHADAVIHAGDFGFYADDSYERLTARELRLLVIHSDLPKEEKDQILALPSAEQIAAAKERRLVGEFPSHVDRSESFRVPVYAVWGNHEDREVVERLVRGDLLIPNLNMIHHEQAHSVGPAFVYGLGGNLLPGSKMLQKPIAGGGGKIWSTLSQYADVVRRADSWPTRTRHQRPALHQTCAVFESSLPRNDYWRRESSSNKRFETTKRTANC